jgi:hypothetical protein
VPGLSDRERRPGLSELDLPPFCRSTGERSTAAQRSYLLLVRLQIGVVLLTATAGALASAVDGADWLGLVAAIAAVLLLCFHRTVMRSTGAESAWTKARGASEAARALAWRYSVGASPFGLPGGAPDAPADPDAAFEVRLRAIATGLRVVVGPGEGQDQITEAMRRLRSSSLEERRAAFGAGRMHDQRSWYLERAARFERLARRWELAFFLLTAASALAGLWVFSGSAPINLVGVASTGTGAVLTWMGARRFEPVAETYTATALEIELVQADLARVDDEAEWCRTSGQAEDVLGHEQSLWRIART